MAFTPQNFVSKVGPAISAAFANTLDYLANSVFGGATTNPAARTALTADLPLEIANGGTAARTAAGAISALGITPAAIGGVPASTFTQAGIGAVLFPQTAAELAASVTPTYTYYEPGDLRRYGAVSGALIDTALAWASALDQCANGGAPVLVVGAYLVNTGHTPSAGPVVVRGAGYGLNYITTSADITLLTLGSACAYSAFSDVTFTSTNGASTRAAIAMTDCPNCTFVRVGNTYFKYGLSTAFSSTGCYGLTFISCRFVYATADNFHFGQDTNTCTLINCTFGGGAQRGIFWTDSGNLTVVGGDCEGNTVCAIDIDAQTGATSLSGNVSISGLNLESNKCTGGDIRIGNTYVVKGITLKALRLNPSTSAYFLNAVAADAVTVDGCYLLSGYGTATWNITSCPDLAVFSSPSLGTPSNGTNGAAGAWYSIGQLSYGLSATAAATGTGGTIATSGLRNIRVKPTGAITGVILATPSTIGDGQRITVLNESAYSITFAAVATSGVSTGTGCVIAALSAQSFTYNSSASTPAWYPG